MTSEFINGFIKRAHEKGFSESQALEIIKKSFWGDTQEDLAAKMQDNDINYQRALNEKPSVPLNLMGALAGAGIGTATHSHLGGNGLGGFLVGGLLGGAGSHMLQEGSSRISLRKAEHERAQLQRRKELLDLQYNRPIYQ